MITCGLLPPSGAAAAAGRGGEDGGLGFGCCGSHLGNGAAGGSPDRQVAHAYVYMGVVALADLSRQSAPPADPEIKVQTPHLGSAAHAAQHAAGVSASVRAKALPRTPVAFLSSKLQVVFGPNARAEPESNPQHSSTTTRVATQDMIDYLTRPS